MVFDKRAVVDHIRQQVGPEQAQQEAQSLPDQVDPEQHGEMLQQFGVNPQTMASQLGEKLGGRFGDTRSQIKSQAGDEIGKQFAEEWAGK